MKSKVITFAALIICCSVQITLSIPTSTNQIANHIRSTRDGPLAVTKQIIKRPRNKIRKIPEDLDLDTLPLKDLVKIKPAVRDLKADKQMYRKYFANHHQVRKINLLDKDHNKVTDELMQLSGDGKQESAWKRRLATSIKDLLDDSPFQSDTHRKAIRESLAGLRLQAYENSRYQDRVSKTGRQGLNKQRKLAQNEFRKQNDGFYYGQKARVLKKVDPLQNLPLSYHIGQDANHLEAVEQANKLKDFYSSNYALTNQLKMYLKGKKVSDEDYKAAVGLRSRFVKLQGERRQRTNKGKGKRLEVSNMLSDSQEASSSEYPQASALIQHPSRYEHNLHHASHHIPALEGLGDTHVNAEDWKFLEKFLQE
jgi:hypothetical protein